MIGDFIWTAIDYLGDHYSGFEDGDVDQMSGRHPSPWHISFCGDLDLVGHPKPQSLYRQVLWGMRPISILVHRPLLPGETETDQAWGWPMEVPSWNWEGHEGIPLGVRVFSRGCESVQLVLNGKTVGEAHFQANLTAYFEVAYQPGTLKALCVNGSDVISNITTSLRTTGAASSLWLTADRTRIRHDRNDLSYVTVSVVDAKGAQVPDANVTVALAVDGVGELVAVGSGDPTDVSSFLAPNRTTWRGSAVAVLRPTGQRPGRITIRASAPGLSPAMLAVATYAPV